MRLVFRKVFKEREREGVREREKVYIRKESC